MISKGDPAKNFSLKDQDGNYVSLNNFSGKKVLLSFHPLAWTKICAEQMNSLEDNQKTFSDLNTVPLGVSIDHVPCKNAWADSLNIAETRLLCDFWPHGEVAKLYGVFKEERGVSGRANIVISENRKIEFVKIYPTSELPDIEEVIKAIKDDS